MVSLLCFLSCFLLFCNSSARSSLFIFGKEHMIFQVMFDSIRVYELLIHLEVADNLGFLEQFSRGPTI